MELLTAEAKLESLIIEIERKYQDKEVPEKVVDLLDTLKMQRLAYLEIKELSRQLGNSRRGHTLTSHRYCKAILLNQKAIITVKQLEKKNAELMEGL